MRRVAYGLLVTVTLAVYVVMLVWSIPRVSDAAGGQPIFDMRPLGYSLEEARRFLGALTPEGRYAYLDVQLRLDTVFPALYGAALGLGLYWLWRAPRPWLGRGLAAVAVAAAVADYMENARVVRMLNLGAGGVTAELVAAASTAGRVKAALTVVAFAALLAGVARLAMRRRTGT